MDPLKRVMGGKKAQYAYRRHPRFKRSTFNLEVTVDR